MNDEATRYGSADLYDILERCDNEGLTPMVALLVASPASVLELSRAYELHHPNHVRYADRIGDEIYRLALEAMTPKDRQRPSYEAMIEAVCKKIGLPVSTHGVERSEGAIFNTFAPRHLEAMPVDERRSAMDDIRAAASTAADGLLTVPAWPAFVGSVIELAVLRRKQVADGTSGSLEAVGTPASMAATLADDEGSLVIASEDGSSMLSIRTATEETGARWRRIDPDDSIGSILLPILKSVQPFIAADRVLANGDFVRVGIEGGAAALSRSKVTDALVGSAIGHKGQVPFLPVAVDPVAWPAAVAMLASAYMEQKRFENIERSLKSITSSLAEVTRFQDEERRSVLTGSIHYFHQVSRAVLAGELDEDVLHAIERHESDLIRIQNHLCKDIEAQIAVMWAMKNEGWTSTKFVKSLKEEQAKLARFVEDAATCMQGRACGYQLLCAFPGRIARKQARREEISISIERLCPDGDIGGSIDKLLREKLKGISSIETKAIILGEEDGLFSRMGAFRTRTATVMEEARRVTDEPTASLSLTVRMQNGAPVAVAVA